MKKYAKLLDFTSIYHYNLRRCLKKYTYNYTVYNEANKEVDINENDIPAKKEIQSKSTRIQSKNEHSWRQKGTGSQKSKRKKTVISIGRRYVAFSSI